MPRESVTGPTVTPASGMYAVVVLVVGEHVCAALVPPKVWVLMARAPIGIHAVQLRTTAPAKYWVQRYTPPLTIPSSVGTPEADVFPSFETSPAWVMAHGDEE